MTPRLPVRKLCFKAHWIVGITVGVILLMVGVTGGLLAFEQQLLNALNADARSVVPRGARLSPPALLQRLEQRGIAGRIASLAIPADPREAVRVNIVTHARSEARYLDPYTAEWHTKSGTFGEGFFKAMRDLHQSLIVAGKGDRQVGRQITGACSLLLVGLALSGLYLRWPRRTSNWRAWLLVNTRLRGRGFLFSLHTVVGTYVLIPYLFLALTGLYWSYEWYRSTLYKIAGVEQRIADGTAADPAKPTAAAIRGAWSGFARETQRHGFGNVWITIPAIAARPIEFRYLDPRPAHRHAFNTFAADSVTGEALRHERYVDKPPGGKLMSSMFALHTGSFFGTGGSLLLMLASLAMPLFGITGWMMYIHRRRTRGT